MDFAAKDIAVSLNAVRQYSTTVSLSSVLSGIGAKKSRLTEKLDNDNSNKLEANSAPPNVRDVKNPNESVTFKVGAFLGVECFSSLRV